MSEIFKCLFFFFHVSPNLLICLREKIQDKNVRQRSVHSLFSSCSFITELQTKLPINDCTFILYLDFKVDRSTVSVPFVYHYLRENKN